MIDIGESSVGGGGRLEILLQFGNRVKLQNPPTMEPALNGRFREVVGYGIRISLQ